MGIGWNLPAHCLHELAHVSRASGTWELSDEFYMMTDAMACWFLAALEDGEAPAGVLQHLEQFEEWIESLRDGRMRNDDVTVLRISVS